MYKDVRIPENYLGAVKTALRVRIIYLQSWREQFEREGYKQAAQAIMEDIAHLTEIADKLDEQPMEC